MSNHSEPVHSKEPVIQVSGVKKQYKLGQIGGGTLTADLQSWWARIRGKEDPNLPIGTDTRLFGQTFMALNGVDLTVYKARRWASSAATARANPPCSSCSAASPPPPRARSKSRAASPACWRWAPASIRR